MPDSGSITHIVGVSRVLSIAFLLVPSVAAADALRLVDGTELQGEVERRGTKVILHIDGGTSEFDASEVAAVTEADTRLAEYGSRRANLMPRDVAGRLRLARWANEVGLTARARQNYREVIRLVPDNTEARRALGHVKFEGQWLTEDEGKRAKGLVQYLGVWMTPQEAQQRQQRMKERAEKKIARAQPQPEATPAAPLADADDYNVWDQSVFVQTDRFGNFVGFGQPLVGFGSYFGFGSVLSNNPWFYYGVQVGNPAQAGLRPRARPRGRRSGTIGRGRPRAARRPSPAVRSAARLPSSPQRALPRR